MKSELFLKWDREWWNQLERNWKVILLSNYLFNYDKFNTWSIGDCHAECPAYFEGQSNEDYVISFALQVGGGLIGGSEEAFKIHLDKIPNDILVFICNNLRFLWCSRIEVSNLYPLDNLTSIKEIYHLQLKNSLEDTEKLSSRYRFINYCEDTNIIDLKK